MLRTMRTGAIGTIVTGALALVSFLSMTVSTRAQEEERPYPKMLPLSEYLMDRNAAIALARSAAPDSISKDASVLVLTPKGWETAVKGTNGFVCMAGPSWTASIDFYDVWSPKQKAERGDLPQSSGRAVNPADLLQDDANDAGWSSLG